MKADNMNTSPIRSAKIKFGKICEKHPELNGERYANSACKSCATISRREWRRKYPDKYREQKRRSNNKNREKYLSYHKRYYEKNKDAHRERMSGYYKNNKEKIYKITLDWIDKNRERYLKIHRKYFKNEIENLSDWYIKNILCQKGISREEITQTMIEIQRLLIKAQRLLKQEKQNEKK